jgi:phosphoribosylaminoimidazole-succinocarboxamide synthase
MIIKEGEMATKKEQLYEGKAKKVYATDDPGLYIVSYKDDATAFNGEKKGTIADKGVVNNIMSNIVFELIEESGVPTHFVEQLSDRDTLVKAVTILPLEFIIRNVAAGSFSKRYGVEEGTALLISPLEFSYKNDELGDPLINDDHVIALGLATPEEISVVKEYAHKVNKVMSEFFLSKGLKLIDFKIEFGKTADGTIILADEVSPDTCRLWDVETNRKMDKDRFRRDLGDVEETYQQVLARVKGE